MSVGEDHLNALQQVSVSCGALTLNGFSISGLATYVQVPELDVCFDMGECPLSALSLDHVFLTHAHGDHARCIARHWAVRRMVGNAKPAVYFLPAVIRDGFAELIRAEARFEGVPEEAITLPELVAMVPGEVVTLPHRADLRATAFVVTHSVPSLGYTISLAKKKLRPEFAGMPGAEIARRRKAGEEMQMDVVEPLVTFIGDCDGASLLAVPEIFASPVVVLESTFLDPGELELARAKLHTHIDEIVAALESLGEEQATFKHLVLKHFSMRYTRDHVFERVKAAIPAKFADRVRVFL